MGHRGRPRGRRRRRPDRDRPPASTRTTTTARSLEKWGDKEWLDFGIQNRKWTLSQFLHGEQGALLCTAKITETVPWYDAKLYAATQVVDEARHVEVFARYLDEKLGGGYQVNAHLRMLLDDIINDSRWDMTYLGMQVMVEGLALAAFGFMHQMTEEPLLKQLLRYVMSDEARHVAFGVLSLKEVYDGMTDAEMKDRQEFAYEAAVRMRDRFMSQEVWERHGRQPPRRRCRSCCATRPATCSSRCCSPRSCPNCKKLGLLDRNEQVAAPPLRGDGRHPVRGPRGHRRGVHQVRARRRGRPSPSLRLEPDRRRVTRAPERAGSVGRHCDAERRAIGVALYGTCMPDAWDPAQYEKFAAERAQPFWDLAALARGPARSGAPSTSAAAPAS